ncbi:TPA: hypothetical protein DCZ39_05200 [Patescibacteria group bacterium]|nr:hypothetical protein [Candidatus Gracilibacteria bacterium]
MKYFGSTPFLSSGDHNFNTPAFNAFPTPFITPIYKTLFARAAGFLSSSTAVSQSFDNTPVVMVFAV